MVAVVIKRLTYVKLDCNKWREMKFGLSFSCHLLLIVPSTYLWFKWIELWCNNLRHIIVHNRCGSFSKSSHLLWRPILRRHFDVPKVLSGVPVCSVSRSLDHMTLVTLCASTVSLLTVCSMQTPLGPLFIWIILNSVQKTYTFSCCAFLAFVCMLSTHL